MQYNNRPEKLEYINPDGANYRFDNWGTASEKHLKEQGFVVIKSILNPAEIIHAKSLLWKFLNNEGWKRNDPSTWDPQFKLTNKKGVVWAKGAGHCEYTWFIRTRPRVVQTFADLWSAQHIYKNKGIKFTQKDMITSFDGFSVFRPWYLPNKENWKTEGGWWHVDQNVKRKPNIDCVQGIVSLYDQDKSTGSTAFVPGSHHWVQTVLPNLTMDRGDFAMIPKGKLEQMRKRKLLLCCKAGDLVLWDSRTIHCNSPSLLKTQEMRRKYNTKWNAQNGKNKKQTMSKKLNDELKEQAITNNELPRSQSEKRFIETMKNEYLKPKMRKNLNGMNKIEYNGYIVEVVPWEHFHPKLFKNGKKYLFYLPWNTSLLWIPNWFDKITSQNLKNTILERVEFEEPTLRFDKKNKNGQVIGITEVKQPRSTAWISNDFNQRIQNREDSDTLPAIPLEEWSQSLCKHASNTASNDFNSMLVIHYKNGNNSIGAHCDDDEGLGKEAIIGSLTLGQKRTFFIRSKQNDPKSNKKIQFGISLINGSFLVMNAGFQNHWLHSVPKEKNVIGDRINITFRKYNLTSDKLQKSEMKKTKLSNVDVDDVNAPRLLRAVSYVCMVPKMKIKDQGLMKRRVEAFESKSTMSHSPHDGRILHTPPQLKGQRICDVKNPLIRSLIGVDMLPKNGHNNDENRNNMKKNGKSISFQSISSYIDHFEQGKSGHDNNNRENRNNVKKNGKSSKPQWVKKKMNK